MPTAGRWRSGSNSFSLTNDHFAVDGKRIRIQNLGWVRMRESVRFTGKILSATVSRVADKWYVSVAVDTPDTSYLQMHHKVQTFEHVNRKLVLVIQDKFLAYMRKEFKFDHVKDSAVMGNPMHIHAYRIARAINDEFRLSMISRSSTDAAGMATCLGLQANACIELEQIIATLQAKISPATMFRIV